MRRHVKASSAGSASARRPRRGTLAFATVCAAAACSLALTAAPALALTTHAFSTSFGSAGSGDGQLSSPQGVAVNSTSHDVYVADTGNARIEQFSSAGTFIRTFGTFTTPTFVAVDNGALSPSDGDVYVADTATNLVQKFDSSGNLIAIWGSGGQLDGSLASGGPFTAIAGIAVDTSGNLFVYDPSAQNWFEFAQDGTADPTVPFSRGTINSGIGVDTAAHFYKIVGAGNLEQYDTSGNDLGDVTGDGGTITGLAVDPSNNDVYADDGGTLIRHYDSSCVPSSASCTSVDSFGSGNLSAAAGLALDPSSGTIYAADSGTGQIVAFTLATLPDQTTGSASNLAPNSATLSGTVNPQGVQLTDCHFSYVTDAAFNSTGYTDLSSGGSAPCVPAAASIAADSSDHAVSADLSGLSAETTYHFRLAAANANGAGAPGADQTFTTAPAVAGLATGSATNVAATSATLNATFTGVGAATHCYFDYGTDTSYGSTSSTPPGTSAGSGTGSNQPFAEGVTGLTPETTYHFRVVCTNSFGTTKDSDQTFTTAPAVAGLSTDPATNILATSATLNGSLDPAGHDTTYHFEYISDFAYVQNNSNDPWAGAQQTPTASTGAISGNTPVSADIGSLSPGTKYHFRIVATNSFGTTIAAEQTFVTVGRYRFSTDFGSSGTGDGQLANPRDVAVDNSSGDLYVADTGNHRVVKLDSSGNFLAAWGWGVSDGSAAAQVCTSGCQAGIPGSGAGQFTTPTFIEVDNSTGPSAGDVYVADTADGVVQKFDPSGALITSWGSGGAIDFSSVGPIAGITVDTVGDLFVLTSDDHLTEVGQDGVFRTQISDFFSSAPKGTGIETDSAGGVFETMESGVLYRNQTVSISFDSAARVDSGLAVDRTTSDLYVDQGDHIEQFAARTAPGCDPAQAPCPPSDVFGAGNLDGAAGLAFNSSSGALYAANAGDNDVAVFAPRPVPDVTTNPVTNQAPTSATLTGHLNPHGAGDVTDCHFDYGTDTTYSLGSVPCTQATPLSGPTDVSADLSGLTPFTTYHYRLVASGADDLGLLSYGADRSFTPTQGAAPIVDQTSASGLTQTTATLGAQINPNLATTVYRFQYGANTSYGSQTLASDPIGSDGVDHAVSNDLSGLSPGTTYHFRVLAVNFNGVTAGPDQAFSTPDLPSVAGEAASAISQTAATLSAQVKPGFSPTTYHFEYGKATSYGTSTPESASIGSDNSVHAAGAAIASLSPSTTYHFRVVATNGIGAAAGPDQTFTTAPTPVVTPPPPPRHCKAGFVKKHGKCVKKHHKRRHHKRSL